MSEFYVVNDFYRGFIKTNNKVPQEAYKNVPDEQLAKWEDVKDLDAYNGLLNEDSILVDCDTMEEGEILLNAVKGEGLRTLVYRSNKGMHFLFKNRNRCVKKRYIHNEKDVKVAIGFKYTDLITGTSNGNHALKKNGKTLTVIYDSGVNGVYDELPCWLRGVDTKKDFIGMCEGDGRDPELFTYRRALIQHNHFTHDECIDTISVINKYVLKEPLAKSQLDKILRKEELPPEQPEYVNENGKLLVGAFSDFIRDTYNIIKLDSNLYFYNNGVYICGDDRKRYIETFLEKHYTELNNTQTKECMGKLYRRISHDSKRTSERYIAFKNGVYDVDADIFIKGHNPDNIFTSMIPFNYPEYDVDDVAENNGVAEFVNGVFSSWCCDNTELVDMLFQIIGHTFYRKNIFSPVFILSGDGQNGKSTFLNLVEYILNGDGVFENTSNLTIQELNQRFKRIRLKDKLANICNDIPSEYINDPSVLKMLASGEAFDVEPKGKDGFTIRPYATMVFGANDIPRFNDMSQGTIRRMFIIPFDRVFTKDDADFDPNLPEKLRDNAVIEYVIYKSVQWLIKIIHNKGFFVPQATLDEREELEYRNNSIRAFLSEIDFEIDILNKTTTSVYRKYIKYCNDNGIQSKGNRPFGGAVCKMFSVKSVVQKVDGKPVRIYRKK